MPNSRQPIKAIPGIPRVFGGERLSVEEAILVRTLQQVTRPTRVNVVRERFERMLSRVQSKTPVDTKGEISANAFSALLREVRPLFPDQIIANGATKRRTIQWRN